MVADASSNATPYSAEELQRVLPQRFLGTLTLWLREDSVNKYSIQLTHKRLRNLWAPKSDVYALRLSSSVEVVEMEHHDPAESPVLVVACHYAPPRRRVLSCLSRVWSTYPLLHADTTHVVLAAYMRDGVTPCVACISTSRADDLLDLVWTPDWLARRQSWDNVVCFPLGFPNGG